MVALFPPLALLSLRYFNRMTGSFVMSTQVFSTRSVRTRLLPHLVILALTCLLLCRVFGRGEPDVRGKFFGTFESRHVLQFHQYLYGSESSYSRSSAKKRNLVAVFFVTAQEGDLPVDPGNLSGKVLIEIDQEIKRFLEVICIKPERLEQLNILEASTSG